MILKEVLEKITGPNMIAIVNQKDEVIYKGYKGVYENQDNDECEVDNIGIYKDILPKNEVNKRPIILTCMKITIKK